MTLGLRALPRPQVRSDPAEGLLPAVRVLQQRSRAAGRDVAVGNSPPMIKAPAARAGGRARAAGRPACRGTAAFARLEPELAQAQQAWERSLAGQAIQWQPSQGLAGALSARRRSRRRSPSPETARRRRSERAERRGRASCPGKIGDGGQLRRHELRPGPDLTGFILHGYYEDAYTFAAWINATAPTGAIVTQGLRRGGAAGAIALNLKDGKLEYNNVNKWLDEAIRIQTKRTVPLNEWHHVAVTFDGARTAEGVKLYVDGEEWPFDITVDDLNNRATARPQPLRIGGGGGAENRFKGEIDNVLRVRPCARPGGSRGACERRVAERDCAAKPESRTHARRARQDSRLLPGTRRAGRSEGHAGNECSTHAPNGTPTTTPFRR